MRVLGLFLMVLASCTLYERKGGSDDLGDSGGGGSGPAGRSFSIERLLISSSPCPLFANMSPIYRIDVFLTSVVVDDRSAFDVQVRESPARESDGANPNVQFSIDEVWFSGEGDAFPFVRYQMWVDGSLVSGRANASFPFQGTTCSYEWLLSEF
jgi:hypothetical protein